MPIGSEPDQRQNADSDELSFTSPHLTIKYSPNIRLRTVNKRLSLYFRDFVLDRKRPRKFENDEIEIAFKLNKIRRKVMSILDMRPPEMKISVKIFKNQNELDNFYYSLFHSSNTRRIISFYIHSHKTIYTTERAISSELIAHEMAHAVLRHYFRVRPPTNVDELMAQYAETHLHD
ncbi:MAG: hypothetical protein P9M07_02765 [Candidatus Aceula meridiana]|nr:hypothetical protein [Candidatus Aceula meridiana]